jgi:hypothetical protein
LFLIYIDDLPKTVNNIATPILFAEDTTILITSPNKSDFQLKVTTTLNLINPLPALTYLNILDLNVTCQAKRT